MVYQRLLYLDGRLDTSRRRDLSDDMLNNCSWNWWLLLFFLSLKHCTSSEAFAGCDLELGLESP